MFATTAWTIETIIISRRRVKGKWGRKRFVIWEDDGWDGWEHERRNDIPFLLSSLLSFFLSFFYSFFKTKTGNEIALV